jgi:hypothetical protein
MTEFSDELLTELRGLPWWPHGWDANIQLGPAGHDREITIGFNYRYDWDNPIPNMIVEAFTAQLPETWKVESRGTRIEVHPSGHFAGGFAPDDAHDVARALAAVGFKPKVMYPHAP